MADGKRKKQSINVIIQLITQFLQGEKVKLIEKSSLIFHYYIEIVRYWNKLNFIVNKTLRSLDIDKEINNYELSKYLYSTYRMIWEKGSEKQILNEVKLENPFYFSKLNTFSWDIALKDKSMIEHLSIVDAIPTFFIQNLLKVMDLEFLKKNLQIMNNFQEKEYFTVHLNKNVENILRICAINSLQKEINKNEEIFIRDPNISDLYHIRINYKKAFLESELFKSGDMIFLDKASAVVVQLLSPVPNDLIFDMCSAPGVKTSLLLDYTSNEAQIIADEFLSKRAYHMKRFMRARFQNLTGLINTDSILPPLRNEVQFDKILLDAPCTGSGTFLTNPELKWRQNERFLNQNVIVQKKLLQTALELLKPSGILVYSTCSLYPQEGELQILEIIDQVEPLELPDWFSPSYRIDDNIIPGTGRLFPSVHNTQGFFVGKFKKK